MARVRAPEPVGAGGWINTGGASLSLAALRGRIVILDFWTFCCINCLHVLDELRALEAEFPEELVIIGVHSPKFAHEAEHASVLAAVERYEVEHPVLDDPDLATWRQYGVRAWPTLVVVDADGYIAGVYSGEGHLHALRTLVSSLIRSHTIRRGDQPYVPPVPSPGLLRFPSRTIVLPDGRLAVADAGHHRIVVLEADGETVHAMIGDGSRGLVDGPAGSARFSEPSGLCVLPDEVAATVGYRYVVADTVNHALRGIDDAGTVRTIAGTGRQWMQRDPLGGPASTPLSSPWDVVWSPEDSALLIAMAGIHQLWAFDPISGRLSVRAGTTNEGLVDGRARTAWLAQPSGFAIGPDGAVWFVDSETSSLRRLRDDRIETVIGTGLFDFGLRDGAAATALLQHPLGLAVLPDGSIAIADTYNGAIRRYADGVVSTLASGLLEPSDVTVVGDLLLVTESAAHGLTRIPLGAEVRIDPTAYRTQRPPTSVREGMLRITVAFEAPAGQKLDDREGPATRVSISSTPPELLLDGPWQGTELEHDVRIAPGFASGVLHVAARAASCDIDAEFPACHVHQQDWGVPVLVEDGGVDHLTLALGGA